MFSDSEYVCTSVIARLAAGQSREQLERGTEVVGEDLFDLINKLQMRFNFTDDDMRFPSLDRHDRIGLFTAGDYTFQICQRTIEDINWEEFESLGYQPQDEEE